MANHSVIVEDSYDWCGRMWLFNPLKYGPGGSDRFSQKKIEGMVKTKNSMPAPTAEKRVCPELSVRANVTSQPDACSASATADLSEEKPASCTDEDDEDTINQRLEAFLALKKLPFPAEVPLQYSFTRSEFYVRQCYVDYYDHIMNLFHNNPEQGVSATGTPGEQ